ncbi:MAG: DinB family protein [Planctomycetes bacterium]|nr:DinB family protein [Planctomycetota bacterium]
MNPDLLIGRLEAFAYQLRQLVQGLPSDQARWRPAEGGMSVLEIVGNLCDREVLDFRPRLELTLRDPEKPWPRVEADDGLDELNYNERKLDREAEKFQRERLKSVQWLKGLGAANWTATHEEPKLGPVRAGDLLVSWASYDAIMTKMIARRSFDLSQRDAPGFVSSYAGEW